MDRSFSFLVRNVFPTILTSKESSHRKPVSILSTSIYLNYISLMVLNIIPIQSMMIPTPILIPMFLLDLLCPNFLVFVDLLEQRL